MGYCVGGSRQAAIRADCDTRSNLDLGSGGGHGKVEGGQGGGAIRIHMDVEAVIEGRVSADGEDSACIQVETEGPVLDRWDQRPYPGKYQVYLLYWYKRTNTDADAAGR